MIIFLTGNDSFRLQQRLNILKQGFINKYDKLGFNMAVLPGVDLTIEKYRKNTMSTGLFVKKRFVVIKDIFSIKDEKLFSNIAEHLEKTDKDNIIIFTATELPKDKDNVLLKKLLKADLVEQFPLLKAGEIFHWVQRAAKNKGATITSDAATYLVEAVGQDLWRMNNELDKIISSTKHITIKEAQLFVASSLDDNIFNFMDAISNKDAKRAIKLLNDQLAAGANEFYLITMLARQIKILLQIKENNGEGSGLHPFVIKKALPQAKKYRLADLRKLFAKLTSIDQKLKTTAVNSELLLDIFVVEMCQ